MLTGAQNVLAYASDKETHLHWKIYRGSDVRPGSLIASTDVYPECKSNMGKEFSHEKLKQQLNLLPPGNYVIQLKTASNENNGNLTFPFEIGYDAIGNTSQVLQQNIPSGMIPMSMIEMLVKPQVDAATSRIELMLLQSQLSESKKENEKLRRGKTNAGDTIAMIKGAIELFSGMVNRPGTQIGLAGASTPPVPGIEDNKSEEEVNDNTEAVALQEVYKNTLEAMKQREGSGKDFIIMLYCFNRYIEDNESTYNALRPMIDKYKTELNEFGINTGKQ